MYNLTDFSLEELRYLSRNMDIDIYCHQDAVTRIKNWEEGEFRSKMLSKHNSQLEMCREMNVRFLTALQIVKERETTNAN